MSNSAPQRTFAIADAARRAVNLLLGIVGPSGSGKTYSALRLAGGIQRVVGGDIHVVNTENRRSLHYCDTFRFKHVPFAPPFSPADYIAAMRHCLDHGAKTIIIDSVSHEHAGEGGTLEAHDRELDRMCGDDWKKRAAMSMVGWVKPKAERQKMINFILQANANFILLYRAKEKLRIVRGKEPEPRGFMPIGAEELIFELLAKFLLLPGANGIPTWSPEFPEERAMIKLPEMFRSMFGAREKMPLDEAAGEALARWAAGSAPGIAAIPAVSPGAAQIPAAATAAPSRDLGPVGPAADSPSPLAVAKQAAWSAYRAQHQGTLAEARAGIIEAIRRYFHRPAELVTAEEWAAFTEDGFLPPVPDSPIADVPSFAADEIPF